MCVLVLARSNGTLFNSASIQEEDIVELCVEEGQTHPKGVLWFSAMELVILFHSSDKIQVAVCRVTKAMALCEEPIWVQSHLPSIQHQ